MSETALQFDCAQIARQVLDGELKNQLADIDRKRKIVKVIGFAFVALGGAGLLGSKIFQFGEAGMVVGMLMLLSGAVLMAAFHKKHCSFYRHQVMQELINALKLPLTYHPDKGLERSRFKKFALFGSFDRYHSEDLLRGTLGKTRIEASEVHIERKHKSKKRTSYSTIFRGVVFIADFNKEFSCRTAILPDVAEKCFGKLMGNFLQNLNFSEKGKLVKLENIEFEKRFAVYSSDQHEARYLLTPQFMEQLLAVQNAEKAPIRALFCDNNLVMTLPRRGGWLEPPFWGTLARAEVLEKSLHEVIEILNIVQLLDLNTRIWTK